MLITLVNRAPAETKTTIVQKVDLSGDVKLEEMTCKACGGGGGGGDCACACAGGGR